MRRSTTSLIGLLCVAAVVVSCRDENRTASSPTSPARSGARSSDATPGSCVIGIYVPGIINQVFGAGSANALSAQSQYANINALQQAGDVPGAQAAARNFASFILSKVQQGGLPGTPAQVQMLINAIYCQTGVTTSATDATVVYPSDDPQTVVSDDSHAGVLIPPNTNDQPIIITFTPLPPGQSPLITKLDQYPSYVFLTETGPLNNPVIVAVCPSGDIPADVLARLRLGHQASGGFEITPPADASFLDCSLSTAQSRVPGWLKTLASLVLPKPLYAKMRSAGGVGGTATEFSPFGPVDPELRSAGGVGGTATEFKKTPTVPLLPGARPNTVVAGVCTAIDAPVGMPVEPQCRPEVTLTTFKGTILQNVPVGWAIDLGGGVAAPETRLTQTCGAFGATASTATDASGKAAVCWNLGPNPGTNTVVATPTAGGDAPPGVTFTPAHITFTATGRAPTTSAVSCPASVAFTGLPVTPCSATVTGSGLSLTPTPTYTGNVIGTATASVDYAGDATHLPSHASTTFKILYAQLSCFGSQVSSTPPIAFAAKTIGTVISLTCALRTAQGTLPAGATGDLIVQDRGVNAVSAPVTVLSVTNAFTVPAPGIVYSYLLKTATGFVSHHFYQAIATWNDGSTSVGWFLIK